MLRADVCVCLNTCISVSVLACVFSDGKKQETGGGEREKMDRKGGEGERDRYRKSDRERQRQDRERVFKRERGK